MACVMSVTPTPDSVVLNHLPVQGDSGGPLTTMRGGQHTIIGVVRSVQRGEYRGHVLGFGKFWAACMPEGRNYYVDLAKYRNWIDGNTKSTKYCTNGPQRD